MITSLPTPQISTNGNSNGHHAILEIPAQELKAATPVKDQSKRKPRRKPQGLILKTESKIEQFKQDLFDSATGNTVLLTGCYNNWFDSQISMADVRADRGFRPETRKKMGHTHAAWKRAKELFVNIAPIVLAELVQEIAEQIKLEYQDVDAVTASDVPANLRNLDLFDLMEHIN